MSDTKPYYTYLTTDSNRKFLRPGVGYATETYAKISSTTRSLSPSLIAPGSRIVLMELHTSRQEAEKRYQELSEMTRGVRERLIRKSNPNWLSISPFLRPSLPNPKKAVAFA